MNSYAELYREYVLDLIPKNGFYCAFVTKAKDRCQAQADVLRIKGQLGLQV